MTIIRSIILFLLALLCKIRGGYMVWQWLQISKGLLVGALGGVVLFFRCNTHSAAEVSLWAGMRRLRRRLRGLVHLVGLVL